MYVNPAGSDATGNGSAASPFRTITHAINAASDPDGTYIFIAAGTYDAALGESFPIQLKSLVSLQGNRADNTVIDAGQTGRVLVCSGNPAGGLTFPRVVGSLTIKNGRVVASAPGEYARGAGILCEDGDATEFSHLIIRDNHAFGRTGTVDSPDGGSATGGGMFLQGANISLTTCVFINNTTQGGAGYASTGSAPGGNGGDGEAGALNASDVTNNYWALRHLTFYKNVAKGGDGGTSNTGNGGSGGNAHAGAMASYANPRVINDIFASNSAVPGAGATGGTGVGANGIAPLGALDCASCDISYNLFYGNSPNNGPVGDPAVFGDPAFPNTTPGSEDLRFTACSPAAHAGFALMQDSFDLNIALRPNPPSMGAYEPPVVAMDQLVISSPNYPEVAPGGSFGLTIAALNSPGHVDTSYAGHFQLTSSDPAATIPSITTLVNGTVSFFVQFGTYGHHTVTVTGAAVDCVPGPVATFNVNVVLNCCQPPINVHTTAVSDSQVSLSWVGEQNATGYQIWRKSETEDYALKTTATSDTWTDVNVLPNHAYVYKVRVDLGFGLTLFSVPYLTTTTVFTEPITPLSTTFKLSDVTELRTAVNAVQRTAGQIETTFQPIQIGDGFHGSHLCQIRNALISARGAIADLPAMSYTDACVAGTDLKGTKIKATHILELRRDTH
jgi:hypothetical protein